MKVLLSDDKQQAITSAAEKIAQYIAIDTWLFISGGSSYAVFEKLDSLLTTDQKQATRLLLVDERYGAEGHENSNWNLLKNSDMSDYASVYPLLDDTLSMQECAQEYDQTVQMVLETDAQTVAILGVGADSHIAGIKPMDQKIFDKVFLEKYVASYIGPDYQRITLTPQALVQLGMRICFVSGTDKVPVIASLAVDMPVYESPVHIIKDLDNTLIYSAT